ncbi:MAG TPA: hypothetical protein V6C97_17500 [Oculatellaceae cyanobacterium]
MTDRVNDGEAEDQKGKSASGLNNSILGGFARTSAKRFAEYKHSAKENEVRTTNVATAAPSNRHNRREWLERLFDLFEQYAVEVNKLVDESHLITTCLRPTDKPSDNPLVSPSQGVVATKYWQLTVRLQADGIAGFILPMSMEKTFLRDESLFERIFLIESLGDENAAVWSFDNKPTEFFQLPDLAKRFFGSLIEIAQMEDMSNFENAAPGEATPPSAMSEPAVEAPIEATDSDEPVFDDEAMFKDLLNFGSTVSPTPVLEGEQETAQQAFAPSFEQADSVTSNSPFAQLSADPVIDLAKLDAQAESMRKKNKTSSSDFATKTLDSYALLDFEDEATYYSEYRLTPDPELEPANGGNGLLSESAKAMPEEGLPMPAKPSSPLSSSMQNMPVQPASPMAGEAEPIELRHEEAKREEVKHEEVKQEEVKQEEAKHEEVNEVVAEAATNESRGDNPVTWESGTPVSWQQTEASSSEEPSVQAGMPSEATESGEHFAFNEESVETGSKELEEWAALVQTNAERQENEPPPPVYSQPKISPVTVDPSVLAEEPVEPVQSHEEHPIAPPTPVITPVTSAASAVQPSWQTESGVEAEAPKVVRAVDAHGYRSNDLDLLTPADVDMTPPPMEAHSDDDDIAQALLKVTETTTPEINESLSRDELSSEVQKLASKLQQSADDFIGAFNRKASELSGEHEVFEERKAPSMHEPIASPHAFAGSVSAATEESLPEVAADTEIALTAVEQQTQPEAAHPVDSYSDDDVDFDEFEKAMQEGVFAESLHLTPADTLMSPMESLAEPKLEEASMANEPDEAPVAAQPFEQSFEHPAVEHADLEAEALHQQMHTDIAEAEVLAQHDFESATISPVVEETPVEVSAEPPTSELVSPAEVMESVDAESIDAAESEDLFDSLELSAPAELAMEMPEPEQPSAEPVMETSFTPLAQSAEALEPPVVDVSEVEAEEAEDVEEFEEADGSTIVEVVEPVQAETESLRWFEESSQNDSGSAMVSPAVPAEFEMQTTSERFTQNHQSSSQSFQPHGVAASAQESQDSQAEDAAPKTFFESLQSITARKSQSHITVPQDISQPQENSMPKTDEMSVVAAIEMMKHSVDQELVNLAEHGARAFQNQDMDAVEKAMKRTRRVQEFKDILVPALSTWDSLGKDD